MNSDLIVLIIIAACAVYLYSRGFSSPRPPQSAQSPFPEPAEQHKQAVENSGDVDEPSRRVLQDDPFLRKIVTEKLIVDEEVSKAVTEYERELDERFSDDLKIKARLSRFAKENGLDRALIAVWEEIKYYPAWSQREDFSKWNSLELGGIDGLDEGDVKTVIFVTDEGQRFILSETRSTGMEGDAYADFSFSEDGVEVFAIGCSADYEEYGVNYQCHTISAFRKRGNWASILLRLYGRTRIGREKLSAKTQYFRADEIKSRFEE